MGIVYILCDYNSLISHTILGRGNNVVCVSEYIYIKGMIVNGLSFCLLCRTFQYNGITVITIDKLRQQKNVQNWTKHRPDAKTALYNPYSMFPM